MSTIAKLAICGLLIVVLAVPAFAGGVPQKKSSSAIGSVYGAGVSAAEQTEGAVSGCLKSCFSLFNPCLDIVKCCSKVVLLPIEKPFDYVEGKLTGQKQAAKKASKIPEPKKPEIPK
ncbi:MAG: hypothetical protein HY912_07140 [Desulfomonile tiedjei]|uniref:Uncharacterized protein n=1 Tax=Desulfomonile tiedjei TaxID=2358 RepID=A0A9D6Z351_9BACT|nr:hypothetical protein [Desulfomonile tiedjei]